MRWRVGSRSALTLGGVSSDSTRETVLLTAPAPARLGRTMTGRMLARGFAGVAALALVALTAAPASAHDTTLPDASYYRSTVTSITPSVPGLKLDLTAGGETVTLTNGTGSIVMVPGYEGEDYLRISPTGVDENTNSLSAFLNGSLVIQGLPQQLGQATPNQPPAWKHVSDKPMYAWHDHRIHWMAQQQPPVVASDPTQPHHVFDWVMPLKVADRSVTVKGSLDWTGKPRLTGLPLALTVIVAVVLGLCLATLLLRLHVKRKEEAAAQIGEPQDTADPDDYVLPAEPTRSSLTER